MLLVLNEKCDCDGRRVSFQLCFPLNAKRQSEITFGFRGSTDPVTSTSMPVTLENATINPWQANCLAWLVRINA